MTDEIDQPESFETFEAKTQEPPKVEEQPKAAETATDKPKDDTLELGGEEAPKVEEDDGESKTRSRHPSQRIAHYRWQAGEAERERDEALARLAAIETKPAPAESAPDPNARNDDGSDKYEFGEADPLFIKDMARFEVRQTLKEERAKDAEQGKKTAEQQEISGKLNEGMAAIEKAGPEKYTDFEDKITEAVEARGGEPLHPMVSIGIAVSPAGADIAYRLATNEAVAANLEKLAQTNPHAAAMAFGELEAEFVDNDSDLNLADPLDMARKIGRQDARIAGKGKASAVERKVTNAPEPAEHRSRGANGQFETRADTPDFPSFERMANRRTA